jgi:uncharacterized protein (TIGR02444 family)
VSAPAGLWEFSLAFYARPGVAPACLDLQARLDADVNLLLAALWCGLNGRGRLMAADLAALAAAVATLQRDVVRPLRQARVALKPLAGSDPALAALRAAIKRAELDAEREEQRVLEGAIARRAVGDPSVGDAVANMTAYLTYLGAAATDSALAQAAAIPLAIVEFARG